MKPLSSCPGAGEAAAGECCTAEDHLCWREGWGHYGERAGSDGGVEGAADLLRGQSCPGDLRDWQGAVLLGGAWKPHVDGRHHGPDRMGWAEVRHLPFPCRALNKSSVLMFAHSESSRWSSFRVSLKVSVVSCRPGGQNFINVYHRIRQLCNLDPISHDICYSTSHIVWLKVINVTL